MTNLNFCKKHRPAFFPSWLFLIFIFSLFAFSIPLSGNQGPAHPEPEVSGLPAWGSQPLQLKPVYKGAYLSLYTSGKLMKQNRHPKSGVWNVPARKLQEMWVKRTEGEELIRLDPQTFRQQLVDMLADFPEVHGAIRHRSFTYKALAREIPNLNGHIDRVILIRQERDQFDYDLQAPVRETDREEGFRR